MKFALVVILSCLCIFASGAQTDTVWGTVTGNVRQIGTETIQVPSTIWTVKTHKFTFPKVPLQVPIAGIRHIDYKSHPVKVDFITGGVGHYITTIQLTSQKGHGINSTFIFYAQGQGGSSKNLMSVEEIVELN